MTTHPGHVNMKRRQRWALIIVGVAAVAMWGVEAMSSDRPAPASESQPPPAQEATHQVVYEIDGQAIEASVTMSTPTGTRQIDANARLGGDDLHEMTVDPGEFLYVSAQNQNELGSIACRIIVDGAVIAENESTASYGIATCEGTAG